MAAIKHDVRVRMLLSGVWTDVTEHVYQRNPITITRGRKDETTKTTPATCSVSLKNNDGRWNPENPMGPYYGTLGQNNPIQVTKRLVLDQFSRTVVDGFGSTDRHDGVPAQRWVAPADASSFDVTPAGGTVTVTADGVRKTYLPDFSQADCSVVVEWSCAVANITGDTVVPGGASARITDPLASGVYARVIVTTSETFQLGVSNFDGTVYIAPVAVSGLTYSANTHYSVRLTVDGRSVAAKLWATSAGEPKDYQVITSDLPKVRGSVGVRTSLGAASTNSPVTITYHRFEVESIRFSGEVSALPQHSDPSGTDQWVPAEISGPMRRLGQGTTPAKSTLRRGVESTSNVVAYWPCEEGTDATSIESSTLGVMPFQIIDAPNLPDFAANDDFACSLPIPTLSGTRWWSGALPLYDNSAGETQVRMLVSVPADGVSGEDRLLRVYTSGTLGWIDVKINPAGHLGINTFDTLGNIIDDGGFVDFGMNGSPLRLSLELTQGSDVDWNLSVLRATGTAGGISGFVPGLTFERVTGIEIGPHTLANVASVAVGHILVQNVVTDVFQLLDQITAYNGERALTRMRRLAVENNVSFAGFGSANDTAKMGPQFPKAYLDLNREAAGADLGTLFEARGINALKYRTRASLYAQSAALTLRVDRNEVGQRFRPVYDDQQTRNDVTAQRPRGGEYRAQKLTGAKNVQTPPAGVGVYDDWPEVAVHLDTDLVDVANWLVTLGTQPSARFPGLNVVLESPEIVKAGHASAVLDLDIDDRVVLTGASSVFIFDDISQILRGYTETLSSHRHEFKLNVSPAAPYDLVGLDSTTQRVDSGSSTLTDELSPTATGAVSVATSDFSDLWTTSGGHFPLDIMVGGERIRLSGISGAASPQTFTISQRSVNGVVKKHNAGAPVHVADPWRLGL